MEQHSPLANSYARSLLELADERGVSDEVGRQVGDLQTILAENPSFAQFLADPAIGSDEREHLLKTVFDGKLDPLLMSFLGVMNDKGRLRLLPEVLDAFDDLLADQRGIVEVDVTVARKLAKDDLENVRQKIAGSLKKETVLHQYVDENILGGLIIRVGDTLIDGSVRKQLDEMRDTLLNAK